MTEHAEVISCFARSSRWQMAIALLADMPAIKVA